MPRALVVIAEGTEEMEATIVVDLLRRAEIDVVVAGLDGDAPVRMSRGVRMLPDVALADAPDDFDALVLPGGRGGADRFAASEAIAARLAAFEESGRLVGAICAAPIALVSHNRFAGHRMTCHPSVDDIVAPFAEHTTTPVTEDRNLVTSRGPGTAFVFGLALIARLESDEVAQRVRDPLMLVSAT